MTPERAQMYENALYLADKIGLATDEGPHVDSAMVAALLESIVFILTELMDGESTDYAAQLPALMRWMRLATTNTRRRSPLEVAAAWEVAALLHDLQGDYDHARADLLSAQSVAA